MTDPRAESTEKCGKFAGSLHPRLGLSYTCVLDKGHEGECQRGGTCFKHGPYVGQDCPEWPNCVAPSPELDEAIRKAHAIPEERAGREAARPAIQALPAVLATQERFDNCRLVVNSLKAENESLKAQLAAQPSVQRNEDEPSILERLTSAFHALRSYQYGNSSPELAEAVADSLEEYIAGKIWITAERGSK